MKYATQKHPAEKAIQQIEEILRKNEMTIYIEPYSGLCVTYKDMIFNIRDRPAYGNTSDRLPRELEEERLFLINPEILKEVKEIKIAGWLRV